MIDWLNHDLASRKEHATKLVKKLRLGVIATADLREACVFFGKHGMDECGKILGRITELQGKNSMSKKEKAEYKELFTPRNIVTVSNWE